MHKPVFWDFEIQTDDLIPTRTQDLMIINKKKKKNERKQRTYCIVKFAVQVDHIEKIKEKIKRDIYLDLAWKLKYPELVNSKERNICKWSKNLVVSSNVDSVQPWGINYFIVKHFKQFTWHVIDFCL